MPEFAPTGSSGNPRWRWLVFGALGCGGLLLLSLVMVVAVALIAGGPGSPGSGGDTVAQASDDETDVLFTKQNYAELVADPEGNRGATVDIVGQVFQPPEMQDGEEAFQMYADPVNSEWNTMVFADPELAQVETDDFVRVRGTVYGQLEGENAFGAALTILGVDAESIETVDAAEALDPAQSTIEVGETIEDAGFAVTVDRIEFGAATTRAYVRVRNGTASQASLSTYDARIVQGTAQIDADVPYEYEFPEPQTDLESGVETEGVVAFGPVDPTQPFRLRLEWFSDDLDIDPQPLVFRVEP